MSHLHLAHTSTVRLYHLYKCQAGAPEHAPRRRARQWGVAAGASRRHSECISSNSALDIHTCSPRPRPASRAPPRHARGGQLGAEATIASEVQSEQGRVGAGGPPCIPRGSRAVCAAPARAPAAPEPFCALHPALAAAP
jgi:hypothetical protein